MPYATNDGVRIHYHVDGNPDGPPLVLQHGFLCCLEDWYTLGYAATLGATYRLILTDARGHGASDKPHATKAYRMAAMADGVVAVLDDLGLARAHFFGYSMGGKIGFVLAARAPERCLSLVLGGSSAADRDPAIPDAYVPLLRQGAQAFATALGPLFWPELRDRLVHMDTDALIALRSQMEPLGIKEALPRVAAPCLVYACVADDERDNIQADAALLPQARFVSIPDLDHVGTWTHAEVVLPHVTAFLAEVERASTAATP